jgi:hypothetical protein
MFKKELTLPFVPLHNALKFRDRMNLNIKIKVKVERKREFYLLRILFLNFSHFNS